GRPIVAGGLDPGYPPPGGIRQARLPFPPGTDWKGPQLRADPDVKGVRPPARWARRQALNEDGSLTLRPTRGAGAGGSARRARAAARARSSGAADCRRSPMLSTIARRSTTSATRATAQFPVFESGPAAMRTALPTTQAAFSATVTAAAPRWAPRAIRS